MAEETIQVIGAQSLAQALKSCAGVVSEAQRVAMAIAMREVREQAIMNHRYTARKHFLEKSVTSESGIVGNDLIGRVFLNEKVAPYARFVHNGWVRNKPIVPKSPRRALAWTAGGLNIVRARVDKGAKYAGDPFLFDAFDAKLQATEETLSRASVRAIVEKLGGE
jgi:hypothetical protein